jgi:hypothetical protein
MSRQNKVNPGMYTQRGRLTQDDAARELKRQRSIGSEHTWQPSKKDHFPRLASRNDDAALGAETSGDKESADKTPSPVKAPASRVTRAAASKKAAPAKQARTAKSKTAKKPAVKARAAKTTKSAKPAAKRAAAKTTRKAVLARNVGGGRPKPRTTAKRRKS